MLQHHVFAISLLFLFHCSTNNHSSNAPTQNAATRASAASIASATELKRIQSFAVSLKKYAVANHYNQSICYLIDMHKNSGEKRFYIYDLSKNEILKKGLVTHGSCGNNYLSTIAFGNTVGCNCSSLGKYKIGKKYHGRFGLAYKLHGLESSNSKAFERFVVLHSHSCVPDTETSPFPICLSNGCPTVSPNFLQQLSQQIDKTHSPILLWIFN